MVDENASAQHIDEGEQFPAGETRTLTINWNRAIMSLSATCPATIS